MNDSLGNATAGARRPQQGGPPLAVLAAISFALLIGGLAIGVALNGVPPSPFGQGTAVQGFFVSHPGAVQAAAVGVFGSSVPMAIYAATASARLRQLGVTAPGATIVLAGGVLAAGALGLAGLLLWTLSRPEVTSDQALARAVYDLVFLTGGPGHVVALGLLVAGMAVPGVVLDLLPKPLAWTGLVIAAIAELTTLVLIWPPLMVLLPVARIPGLVWLIAAGALIPVQRRRREVARS